MLVDDRKLSLRTIAELKISIDSISTIVYEHLKKHMICVQFAQPKHKQMEMSENFIDIHDLIPKFMKASFIIGDES